MVKTLKNLVQASSYIKTSVNNLREVTMLGMTQLLLIFKCFVLMLGMTQLLLIFKCFVLMAKTPRYTLFPNFLHRNVVRQKKNISPKCIKILAGLKTGLFVTQELTGKNHCTKKCIFPLNISSVNVTKSTDSCGFGHIY